MLANVTPVAAGPPTHPEKVTWVEPSSPSEPSDVVGELLGLLPAAVSLKLPLSPRQFLERALQ